MKKIVLGLGISLGVMMVSCEKEKLEEGAGDFLNEVSTQDAVINVRNSSYQKIVLTPVEENGSDVPLAGMLEYRENGNVIAQVDYSAGGSDEVEINCPNGKKLHNFKPGKPHGKKFKKVIVEPIVISEECGYIVAGVVKFFKNDKWVATIDFGDGTCDDIATKTTHEGVFTFTILPHQN